MMLKLEMDSIVTLRTTIKFHQLRASVSLCFFGPRRALAELPRADGEARRCSGACFPIAFHCYLVHLLPPSQNLMRLLASREWALDLVILTRPDDPKSTHIFNRILT